LSPSYFCCRFEQDDHVAYHCFFPLSYLSLFQTIGAPIALIFPVIIAARSLLNASKRPVEGLFVPIFCSIFLYGFFAYLPLCVEDIINSSSLPILEEYNLYARSYVHKFDVADLHCDALLWGARNLLRTQMHPLIRSRPVGSVDVPRLLTGKVKIQVFAVSCELSFCCWQHFVQNTVLVSVANVLSEKVFTWYRL